MPQSLRVRLVWILWTYYYSPIEDELLRLDDETEELSLVCDVVLRLLKLDFDEADEDVHILDESEDTELKLLALEAVLAELADVTEDADDADWLLADCEEALCELADGLLCVLMLDREL